MSSSHPTLLLTPAEDLDVRVKLICALQSCPLSDAKQWTLSPDEKEALRDPNLAISDKVQLATKQARSLALQTAFAAVSAESDDLL